SLQSSSHSGLRHAAEALEIESPAQPHERRGLSRREVEALELSRRERREGPRLRRRIQDAVRRARRTDEPELELAGPLRFDQLAADRAQDRLRHGSNTQ